MRDRVAPYHVVEITPERRVWLDTLDLNWRAHPIFGLLEVDVTHARRFIAAHRAATGENLSFTGYLCFCLARAVDEDKAVQAHRKGRKQLVLFDDVDIGMMIEGRVGEKRALMGYVIRKANHKTYWEIHQEIRSVQSAPVPPNRGMPAWYRSAMLLPWPLSKLFQVLLKSAIDRDPALAVSMAGTVSISSVGMFGGGHSGWGISPTPQPVALLVGGMAWKPTIIEQRIEPREILNLTVMFDHDIVDGAPATRFARRLVELIESGYGLPAASPTPGATTEPAAKTQPVRA
jgi:pyruvate/2-oxoglutarate dehydrogenase complex dihydrolipoamide acyltransferase (E2) component